MRNPAQEIASEMIHSAILDGVAGSGKPIPRKWLAFKTKAFRACTDPYTLLIALLYVRKMAAVEKKGE